MSLRAPPIAGMIAEICISAAAAPEDPPFRFRARALRRRRIDFTLLSEPPFQKKKGHCPCTTLEVFPHLLFFYLGDFQVMASGVGVIFSGSSLGTAVFDNFETFCPEPFLAPQNDEPLARDGRGTTFVPRVPRDFFVPGPLPSELAREIPPLLRRSFDYWLFPRLNSRRSVPDGERFCGHPPTPDSWSFGFLENRGKIYFPDTPDMSSQGSPPLASAFPPFLSNVQKTPPAKDRTLDVFQSFSYFF